MGRHTRVKSFQNPEPQEQSLGTPNHPHSHFLARKLRPRERRDFLQGSQERLWLACFCPQAQAAESQTHPQPWPRTQRSGTRLSNSHSLDTWTRCALGKVPVSSSEWHRQTRLWSLHPCGGHQELLNNCNWMARSAMKEVNRQGRLF